MGFVSLLSFFVPSGLFFPETSNRHHGVPGSAVDNVVLSPPWQLSTLMLLPR